jgi:hypothetical protein
MKKLTTILLITMSILAVTGCSTEKAYQGDNTEESVQVDSTKDTEQIIEIDEKSAQQLVSERLDTEKYSVEKDGDVTIDDVNYYTFKILEGDEPLPMGVAVNKISGELYAYKEDKTIAPYSEFTLYDENEDALVEWDGSFNSDTASLQLFPADENSFEFTFTAKDSTDSAAALTGVAYATGNEAVFEDESGYKVIFVKEDDSITVTESGTGESDLTLAGTYIK